MKTYTTFEVDGVNFHFRVSGNRFGWKINVINDTMLDPRLRCSAYLKTAKDLAEKYDHFLIR
jgi:hypothetical protein